MKNLLFIPCFNDIKNCKEIISEIESRKYNDFDILIVNDGSKNFLKLKSKSRKIIIVNLRNNFGIGHCMRMAIKFAITNNYKNFCRIDSDGEHNPSYIENIFDRLKKNDFIIGERDIYYKEKIFKILSKKLLNFTINKFFRLKLNDYNCGMMGLNSKAMKIISKSALINYPEPQIIVELCTRNLNFEKIIINQRKRYYGKSSIDFFRGIDFLLVTLVFILNYIMNRND